MREKLIKLLKHEFGTKVAEITADYLISKGVTILPEGAIILTRAEIEALNEHNEKVKREFASEIFAEIEFEIHQLDFDREETRAIAIEGIIANAKKKYTVTDTNDGGKYAEG